MGLSSNDPQTSGVLDGGAMHPRGSTQPVTAGGLQDLPQPQTTCNVDAQDDFGKELFGNL